MSDAKSRANRGHDPLYDPPRDVRDLYGQLESSLWADAWLDGCEAHRDGLLIRDKAGREWWVTAELQP